MRDLLYQITIAGKELKKFLDDDPEHPNVMPLRQLSHYCSKQLLESENHLVRFLCFFITCFTDDIFYNLAGEAPYDKDLDEARKKLFREIAATLIQIAGASEMQDAQQLLFIIEGFSKLVGSYADTLNQLNKNENE